MSDQRDRNFVQHSIDTGLESMQGNPFLAQRIMNQERTEQPVMKKKISFAFILAMILLIVSIATAVAGAINEEYGSKIQVIDADHDQDKFLDAVKEGDLAGCAEGGKRCEMCFSMRLQKSYEKAVADGFDYFTTTLTISPLKDAKLINMIGSSLAEKGGKSTMWLPSDFKKNDGYRQSVELSRKYDLYRQNYCGCIYAEP